jgi:hypothetical protein
MALKGSRQAGLGRAAVAALALTMLACACEKSVPPPPPPPPPAPTPVAAPRPPAEQEAVVAAIEGQVERLREGNWAALQVGDKVRTQDSLRTGPKSRTDLEIDAKARITIAEETQLSVSALTEAVHRFNLKRGRVAAAYEASGERVLRIEGERGEVAEANAAHFSVLASEKSFAVASEGGKVNLRAAGTTVTIAEGERSQAIAGEAPTAAAPIPVQLLLKVALAGRKGLGPCAVEGQADPGARVMVEGEPADVDAEGRFSATPKPGPGGKVKVVTVDALGRTKQQEVLCQAMPAKPPPIDAVQIRWRE